MVLLFIPNGPSKRYASKNMMILGKLLQKLEILDLQQIILSGLII